MGPGDCSETIAEVVGVAGEEDGCQEQRVE